jgi:hypothetical protein
MRRRTKALVGVAVIVVAVAVFFLAPVEHYANVGARAGAIAPVYRSLGCATFGLGVLYGQNSFGLQLGCEIPEQYANLA